MLKKIFEELDKWIQEQNLERQKDGVMEICSCEIQVIGQTALVEANLSLHVPATMDVDVLANYEYLVKKKFEELLRQNGKYLDPVGHEAWMPSETEYSDFYIGKWVRAYLAKAEYVMLSKAMKAPNKNNSLITEYLASSPCDNFFKLAEKYKVDLEFFLK